MSNLMQLKRITDGDLEAKLPAAGGYVGLRARPPVAGQFFGKNSSFNAIWITFRTFSDSFERTKFFKFESQLKKSLTLLEVKSKTHVKFLHFGVKFCK